MMGRWGTWEELVLGGAVVRHGTRAWGAVASELRARTLCPHGFTPQECEAKYEDLQERYSGCSAWFEELRKQRVAELKRELERSEDSIGSLQSKIESLMSEREGANGSFNCNAESTVPASNADGATPESPGKERSKDVLSAGSFTEDTLREWLPKTQVPVVDSAHEKTTEAKNCEELDPEKVGVRGLEIGCGNVKKRRGKRKRKGCNDVKEAASVGENEVFSANVVKAKEESSSGGCEQNLVPSCAGSARGIGEEELGLAGILDSIMEPDYTSPFRCRLESQKRSRYKKLIRRHVDFGTIRSHIGDGTILTDKELYRDLLLLCNNALVFFPIRSPEHKSALSLHRSIIERLRRIHPKHPVRPTSSVPVPGPGAGDMNLLLPQRNPVKPRSARPCNRKVAGKLVSGSVTSVGGKEPVGEVQLVECPVRKSVGRPAKGGSRGGRRKAESGGRGRKRARRR
ncbi:Bromodomain-containing protein [Cinnamomum micranthum f. kanehirae]|uniref:Bromodomain-containing protein n=1 Tax=Cinnamomum micranthum f. kanehirae TaxID=337451 RepID=A0A443P101_9MAGN|nr:Bromodomain-containing protein [Cinnamomum micranthum f. kanehirae]